MSHAPELPELPIRRTDFSVGGTSAGELPRFQNPDNFQQSPGNEGHWFCVVCKPSPHTGLHVYNATLAMQHEKSQTHINALKGLKSWGSSTLDSWGYDWGKDFGFHEKLKYDMEREKLPAKKRVRYWIRDMARAEGIQVEEDEDKDELADDGWGDWDDSAHSGLSHKPYDECLPRSWIPASKRNAGTKRTPDMDEVDPQAAADFKFVERVAKARGSAQERKRLHYFYRLPTDEKIKWIEEIVQFISCH